MQELLFPEIVKHHADPVFTDYFVADSSVISAAVSPVASYFFIAVCPMKNGKPYFITGTRTLTPDKQWMTGSIRTFKANKDLAWDDYANRERM